MTIIIIQIYRSLDMSSTFWLRFLWFYMAMQAKVHFQINKSKVWQRNSNGTILKVL